MTDTPETDILASTIDPRVLEHDAYATMTNHAIKLERQRNELLDALERFLNEVPTINDIGILSIKKQARQAIAKVKGETP